MTRVTELGYLGLSVSDPAAWREYAAGVIGMEIVDDGEPDRFYLRMDQWHHRLVVHEDGGDDLAYVGWRVADDLALEEMAGQLTDAGVGFRVGTDAEAAERRVMGLLKLESPGGVPTEIFYSPQVDAAKPFHPGRPMFGRFLTASQGLGHVILNEPDVPGALAFYRLIGLTGGPEVKLTLPDGMVAAPVFMRCNARQHSLAFGLGPMERRVNHLMIEYTDLDDLGLVHDRIRELKIDVTLQLGKHANDQALTFYGANPSGWVWEMGWGARNSGAQAEHYTRDIFGHGNEVSGYGLDLPLK
jgi:2,3-dihydroxyethylbenzene 1,2-dioxygenase